MGNSTSASSDSKLGTSKDSTNSVQMDIPDPEFSPNAFLTPHKLSYATSECFFTPRGSSSPTESTIAPTKAAIPFETISTILRTAGWPEDAIGALRPQHETYSIGHCSSPCGTSETSKEELNEIKKEISEIKQLLLKNSSALVSVTPACARPPPPPPPPPAPGQLMLTPRMPQKALPAPKVTPVQAVPITVEALQSVRLRKVSERRSMTRNAISTPHLTSTPIVTLEQLAAVKLRKRNSVQGVTSPTRSVISRDRVRKLVKSPRSRPSRRCEGIPLSTILMNMDAEEEFQYLY